MRKKFIKAICAALLVAGAIIVVSDAFGTATANQYLFNFCFFTIALPTCIAGWFRCDGKLEGLKSE